MQPITRDSIVVGVDVHKYAHTAVAMDCLGQEIETFSFRNEELDLCMNWLEGLGTKEQLVLGLEDIHGNGIHLSNRLRAEGYVFRYIPAVLTDRSRRHSVHKEKSDHIDASRVGKVILTNGEETLPAETIIPKHYRAIRTIDLLLQERSDLMKDQTVVKNQLHALLHQQYGNGYKKEFKDIFTNAALVYYEETIRTTSTQESTPDDTRCIAESILRRIQRLTLLKEQILSIDRSLKEKSHEVQEINKIQSSLNGCGLLTACKVMAEVKTIDRFSTEEKLAMYAGIAPVRHQSGGSRRMYTNTSGNRKLNQALHTIALAQIGNHGNDLAKAYFTKKCIEGKSKLWAIRCLKRHISRRIFRILTQSE